MLPLPLALVIAALLAVAAAVGLFNDLRELNKHLANYPGTKPKKLIYIALIASALLLLSGGFLVFNLKNSAIVLFPTPSLTPSPTLMPTLTPTPTNTPTPTPTLTPSPTPPPVPRVLCTAGTNNWANWNADSNGWSINNGVLTSDGTQSTQWYNMSLTAPPACQPGSQDENYSVTATAIPIGSPDNFNFLIFVRGNTDNGLQGYAMGIGRYLGDYTEAISIHGFTTYNEIASAGISQPNANTPVTFTASVSGLELNLSVDGYPPLHIRDARFQKAGFIGIYAGSQLQVISFKVTVLA